MENIKITDVRCQKGDAGFLIDDGTTSILYDSGFGFTGFQVAENIKSALGERKLDYIFLTHSHYDHALGSASVLRKYPETKVVAGAYAAGIFQRDGAKRVMKELDSAFAQTCGVTGYEFLGDELRVDITVDDGDIVKAGTMEFQVIGLPGHTRCSIGFYCSEKKLFLSNETLGVYDGGEVIVPSYLVSFEDSVESVKKVEKLDIKYMLAPHLGILSEAQTKFFLENMRPQLEESANSITSELQSGKTTEEIVEMLKNKYLHGYIKEIYPVDAADLNFSIMTELLKK